VLPRYFKSYPVICRTLLKSLLNVPSLNWKSNTIPELPTDYFINWISNFFHCAYVSPKDILFRFFNEKYRNRAEIRRISDPDWICMQILMQLSSGRLNIWNKMDFPDPDVKLSNLNWHLKKLSRGYHKKQELKKLQYSEAPTYKKRK